MLKPYVGWYYILAGILSILAWIGAIELFLRY